MVSIITVGVKSYQVVRDEICKLAGRCGGDRVAYIGSLLDHYEFVQRGDRPLFSYIIVEGHITDRDYASRLAQYCRQTHCFAITKYGKAILEGHNIPVSDVVYHGIPGYTYLKSPESYSKRYDVVYLNHYYRLYKYENNMLTDECERKGWRFWGYIESRFNAVGYTNAMFMPYYNYRKVVRYSDVPIDKVHEMIASGRVFSNLSTCEGFGMNPLTALALGLYLVTWDHPVFVELYSGVPGVRFVETSYESHCYFPKFVGFRQLKLYFEVERWGDIGRFGDAIAEMLKQADRPNLDGASYVREKFRPDVVYKPILDVIADEGRA